MLRRVLENLSRSRARRSNAGRKYPQYAFSTSERALLFRHLDRNTSYLEYGSGHSTIEIAQRVERVVSVEHNGDWYTEIKNRSPQNVELLYRPIEQPHTAFAQGGSNWNELSLEAFIEKDGNPRLFGNYIRAVERGSFDVIVIDGRARVYCVEHVYLHGMLKPHGALFVHDYDRKWYELARLWFRQVERADRLAMFAHYSG